VDFSAYFTGSQPPPQKADGKLSTGYPQIKRVTVTKGDSHLLFVKKVKKYLHKYEFYSYNSNKDVGDKFINPSLLFLCAYLVDKYRRY